ncbi:MAG: T9SS type A sorting domain-containing protein [Bacteroidota bacterium]
MKKSILLLLFTTFYFYSQITAQSCLPTGFTFESQAQIDAFPANYPGCSHILGNVFIEEVRFGAITNLDSLAQLDSISGNLAIRYNNTLNSLKGLQQLEFVGGALSLITNPSLSSLNGLRSLKSVGGSLSIFSNDALLDLGGLSNLDSVGNYLAISENASIINLRGLENLMSVGDNLLIQANQSLQNLNGLDKLNAIGRGLRIMDNNSLLDVNSLGTLMTMNGPLRVFDNNSLSSLYGLAELDGNTITDLSISGCPRLSICGIKSICDYLSTATNDAFLGGNAMGCSNRTQIETACASLVGLDDYNRVEVSIYPNPSSGNIKLIGLSQGNLKIINMVGEEVLEERLSSSLLNLSELSDGIYFLYIQSGDKWASQKFVKQSLF